MEMPPYFAGFRIVKEAFGLLTKLVFARQTSVACGSKELVVGHGAQEEVGEPVGNPIIIDLHDVRATRDGNHRFGPIDELGRHQHRLDHGPDARSEAKLRARRRVKGDHSGFFIGTEGAPKTSAPVLSMKPAAHVAWPAVVFVVAGSQPVS